MLCWLTCQIVIAIDLKAQSIWRTAALNLFGKQEDEVIGEPLATQRCA
ncbi:hypothetical protein O9929_18105 [Vibrio lentus]|nr:hypothetical protein [Vibrio lentus]